MRRSFRSALRSSQLANAALVRFAIDEANIVRVPNFSGSSAVNSEVKHCFGA